MLVRIEDNVLPYIKKELSKTFGGTLDFTNKHALIVVGKRMDIFLVSNQIQEIFKKSKIKPNLFFAGQFIGFIMKRKFFPSLSVIHKLSKSAKKKISINDKAAELFICKRDIFSNSILSISQTTKKGDIVIVTNKEDEPLGYGKINESSLIIKELGSKPVVENILDIGDYLRREDNPHSFYGEED